MKIASTDGSTLMEISELSRNGNAIEFKGKVMGAMPVKGRLTPEEARQVFGLISKGGLWFFFITFLFRKS